MCIRDSTTLESTIQHLTQAPARLFGLRERGELHEGWHADIVVFDPEAIACDEVVMRNDLPGGTKRLYAEATGISRVLVNGQVTVADGQASEATPGVVFRSGKDTETVKIPADA